MKNKITTLKALIDHLHKRKVIISRPQHSVRNKNKLHFSVDFSGIDAVNTTTPGCLCGCGHNLFGLGKTSKGISLFRCNCTNEESMSLGLLSNFSESVMDYEYGYREKFRDYCVGCPLSNTCGGNCKCGENARGNKGRDFFCEGKIELINYLWTKYYSNGYPK